MPSLNPKGPRPAKIVGPGMVKVSVSFVYSDGSQGYRSGAIAIDKAEKLAFKYARSLREAWEFQLVDKAPVPDFASMDDQLLQELQ